MLRLSTSLVFSLVAVSLAVGCPGCPAEGEGEGEEGEGEEGEGEEGEGEGECVVDFNITADASLTKACSPYVVDGDVEVSNNATLTIEPGVVVQLGVDHVVHVGAGKIVADGTADDPIVFTSTNPTPSPGAWIGVSLGNETVSGTSFSFVTFDNGGGENFGPLGCLFLDDVGAGVVSVDHARFVGCAQSAVTVRAPGDQKPFASFTDNTFDSCDLGLRLDLGVLDAVSTSQTYVDTLRNELVGGNLDHDAVLSAQGGTPWVLTTDFNVGAPTGATLTVEAGAVLRFAANNWLAIGDNEPGTLIAVGTEAAPIVFEAAAPGNEAGSWIGVVLSSHSGGASVLRHVAIRGAGQTGFFSRGCLSVSNDGADAITVEDSVFEGCTQAGVSSTVQGHTFASFARNTISDCDVGIWASPSAAGSVDGEQAISGTPENRIDGANVGESVTLAGQTIPWHVPAGDIVVEGPNNPVFTLGEGTTLQFDENHYLMVGSGESGALITEGTEAHPVSIESSDPNHAPGGFIGVVLGQGTLASTVLEHLKVSGGGAVFNGERGCLSLIGVLPNRVSISNSTFSSCAQAGVSVIGDLTTFAGFVGNRFTDNEVGLWLPLNAVGSVGPGQLFTNTPTNQIDGGTLSQTSTWAAQTVPWHVLGDLIIDGPQFPFLNLDAGASLTFDPGALLRVGDGNGGGLAAHGTAQSPVSFDAFGASPQAGDWVGIVFGDLARAGSLIDFGHIAHAGQDGFGTSAAVDVAGIGSPLSITNTVFAGNFRGDLFVSCIAQLLANIFTGNITPAGLSLEQGC